MIGNDIVDRTLAKQESNWRRTGFLDKVFTIHEQQLIRSATDPDCMVWILWSMKESAYKLITRQTDKRIFNPKSMACHLASLHPETVEGSVFHEEIYQTRSLITEPYVATTAFQSGLSQQVDQVIISFDSATYQTQHTIIREKIKQHCARYFSIPETAIRVHKNETGIPVLIIDDPLGIQRNLPLSLSHHGHYGAYALALPPTEVTV